MSSLHYKQEVTYLKKQLESMQAQHDLILKQNNSMHVKDKSRNQERLERIIAKYKANEEAILKEQVLIADERVLTVRKEM
jgi:hypothetical protein